MQRSKCKNANPKKVETRGFSRCPNPGFGFGKMSGLPGFFKTRVLIPSDEVICAGRGEPEESEQNEVDGMKKGADSTGKVMHM